MKLKTNGFICADLYIMEIIHKNDKNNEIHISTQQSITNSKASLFWKKIAGSKRILTAREVDFKNLNLMVIALKKKMDVEYFIHGDCVLLFLAIVCYQIILHYLTQM